MVKLLPLTDHPHPFVVNDVHFHWQAILRQGRHFLHVHHERGFTGNIDHQPVRMTDLNTHRRRQAIAHRAQPAGCHPAVWLLEAEILRCPHLMLAYFSCHKGIEITGFFPQPVDGILWLDDLTRLAVSKAVDGFPFADFLPPCLECRIVGAELDRLQLFDQHGDGAARITDNAEINLNVLVDR